MSRISRMSCSNSFECSPVITIDGLVKSQSQLHSEEEEAAAASAAGAHPYTDIQSMFHH